MTYGALRNRSETLACPDLSKAKRKSPSSDNEMAPKSNQMEGVRLASLKRSETRRNNTIVLVASVMPRKTLIAVGSPEILREGCNNPTQMRSQAPNATTNASPRELRIAVPLRRKVTRRSTLARSIWTARKNDSDTMRNASSGCELSANICPVTVNNEIARITSQVRGSGRCAKNPMMTPTANWVAAMK